MYPIESKKQGFELPTINPETRTFFKENGKLILGIILAIGFLYKTGILRPMMVTLLGPTTYGALKLASRATGYLLMAVPYMILRMTLTQLSYQQLLILGVCAVGFVSREITDRTSELFTSQGNGAED